MDEIASADLSRVHRLAANKSASELALEVMDRLTALIAVHQITIENFKDQQLEILENGNRCPDCISYFREVEDKVEAFTADRDTLTRIGDELTGIYMDFDSPPPEVISDFMGTIAVIGEE